MNKLIIIKVTFGILIIYFDKKLKINEICQSLNFKWFSFNSVDTVNHNHYSYMN